MRSGFASLDGWAHGRTPATADEPLDPPQRRARSRRPLAVEGRGLDGRRRRGGLRGARPRRRRDLLATGVGRAGTGGNHANSTIRAGLLTFLAALHGGVTVDGSYRDLAAAGHADRGRRHRLASRLRAGRRRRRPGRGRSAAARARRRWPRLPRSPHPRWLRCRSRSSARVPRPSWLGGRQRADAVPRDRRRRLRQASALREQYAARAPASLVPIARAAGAGGRGLPRRRRLPGRCRPWCCTTTRSRRSRGRSAAGGAACPCCCSGCSPRRTR